MTLEINDPPNTTPSLPPQHYSPTQPNFQYMPLSSQINADNVTYHETETPTARFEPPGFGSFHTFRQYSMGVITKQEAVTHLMMVADLSKMHEALIQKIIMENGALLATLRNEIQEIKKEIDLLRVELRSTYLSQRIPEGINTNSQAKTEPIDTRREKIEQAREFFSPQEACLPPRPTGKVPSMAHIAAINIPNSQKPANWTMVGNKKAAKKVSYKEELPAPVKGVEESKSRIIFIRSAKAPEALNSTAQDILYTLNMKLLSMKLPAHRCLVKLRYNERGNLTGLITEQTTAEIMVSKFQEVLLKTALRFDSHVKEVQANQQWIGLKVHAAEMARYYPRGGLEQIRKETAAGPSALELAFMPRWTLPPERMTDMTRNGLKQYSIIKITVRTSAEANQVLKQGLHFGGKFHRVEPYVYVGPDIMCPIYCYWGHTTYGYPNPEKVCFDICAEPHLTTEHKCPIATCKTAVGKQCTLHESQKCANCGGSHTARAAKCPDHYRAVTVAKSDKHEWREQEKKQEMRNNSTQEEDKDIESISSEEMSDLRGEIELETMETMDYETDRVDDDLFLSQNIRDDRSKISSYV